MEQQCEQQRQTEFGAKGNGTKQLYLSPPPDVPNPKNAIEWSLEGVGSDASP